MATTENNVNHRGSTNRSRNESSTSSPNEPVKLKKQLGLLNGVGIITGVIIGSGIFVSPKGVLYSAGSVGLSLVIWCLCGLLSMCGALCYAELGTMIPKSGGEFAYLKESFGAIFSFLYLWAALIIIMPTGNAIIALTFAEYILQPFYITCPAPESAIRLLAAAVVMLLTFINCYSVKMATVIQDTLAFCKIIALIIIIITGLIYLGKGHNQGLTNTFKDSTTDVPSIAVAFYSGMFSFSGWNYLNFVTEELKHPMKDLPRAIYISLPLVTFIYLLTNVAYFAVLSREEILSSIAVAGTFGDKVLGSASWIIPVFVALSTFGGLNGGIFSTGRLFFVGAREGHLPSVVAMITIKQLTPAPSLLFLGLLTIFYLFSGHISFLINLTSFVEALFLTLTVGALLYMRYKDKKRFRPIKVNLIFPFLFLIVGILLVVLPFFEKIEDVGFGLAITLVGIPFYLLFVYREKKPKIICNISNCITRFVQKMLLCSPQEKKKLTCDIIEEQKEFLGLLNGGEAHEDVTLPENNIETLSEENINTDDEAQNNVTKM